MKPGDIKFQVYQETGKYPARAFRVGRRDWRWRLVAANGNIIADGSEGYHNASNALRAVKHLIRAFGVNVTGPGWRARTVRDLGIWVEVTKG